uniref:Uncharacterized protein n=1 Tax=Panagrolaimus sp. JU765 TaxID=591449 RepID=A0AC34Q5C8_9BILA
MFIAKLNKNGSVSNNIEENNNCLLKKGKGKNSKTLTTWASYIFIIAAIVITFSVAFAVGFVVNAVGVQQQTPENRNGTAKIISPARYQFYSKRSMAIIQQVRNFLKKTAINVSTTVSPDAHKTRYLHSRLFQKSK